MGGADAVDPRCISAALHTVGRCRGGVLSPALSMAIIRLHPISNAGYHGQCSPRCPVVGHVDPFPLSCPNPTILVVVTTAVNKFLTVCHLLMRALALAGALECSSSCGACQPDGGTRIAGLSSCYCSVTTYFCHCLNERLYGNRKILSY